MASQPIRLGIHDFINAQPLVLPLKMDAGRLNLDLVLDNPARLAAKLKEGELDIAMVPSIEYLKNADAYRLIPEVCIASRGPVGSVLLVSKKPLDEVRTLAMDNRSRTSVALLNILFNRRLSPSVLKGGANPDPERMLQQNDAILIIGDQAFLLEEGHPNLTVYDLSEEWFRLTGKSFVHAVMAVRPEARLSTELIQFLKGAADMGRNMLDAITLLPCVKDVGLSPEACKDYLTNRILYHLGEQELDGLMHFREACQKGHLLDHQHPIEFV
jgi:chorismate dehydratase